MLSIFNDVAHNFYKKMLDIGSAQQDVISNNIANVNTPGFKRSEVDFQEQLKNVLENNTDDDDGTYVSQIQPSIIKTDNTEIRVDGNNVDLNDEMSLIAKNSIMYRMYTQFMKSRFDRLREALKGPQ